MELVIALVVFIAIVLFMDKVNRGLKREREHYKVIAEAYQRDVEKANKATQYWAADIPQIQGLSPENTIWTLAVMFLNSDGLLNDLIEDQEATEDLDKPEAACGMKK